MKPLIWLAAGIGISLTAYLILIAPAPEYATGSTEAGEGQGDQVAGAVKQAAGQVAEAAGQTLHDLNI